MCNVHVAALVAEYLHRKSKFAKVSLLSTKVSCSFIWLKSFFLRLCPKNQT